MKKIGIPFSLVLVVWIFCIPSIKGDFQFDDYHHIVNNRSIYSLKSVPEFFSDPRTFSSQRRLGMYRPVLLAAYALDYCFFGTEIKSGWHAVNVLLHCLNSLLLFFLARRLTGSRPAAFLVGLAFGLAAVNSQSVNYLSARSSLLACSFMLAAILVDDPERETTGKAHIIRAASAVLLFLLALGARELAFSLPFIIIARDMTVRRENKGMLRARLASYILYLAAALAYLALRYHFFDTVTSPYAARSIPANLMTQAAASYYYLAKTFYPVHLSVFPFFDEITSPGDARFILAAAGLAVIAALIILSRRKAPLVSFGLVWFFLALLPSSSLAPLNMIVSESRVYFACAGLILAASSLVLRAAPASAPLRKVFFALVVLIVSLQGIISAQRSSVWSDHILLWRDAVRKAPDLSAPYAYLGMHALVDNKTGTGRKALVIALHKDPHNTLARLYVALYFHERGMIEEARREYLKLLGAEILPMQKVEVLAKLALIEIEEGDLDKAGSYVDEALLISPDEPSVLYAKGLILEKKGNTQEAVDTYWLALAGSPYSPDILTALGILLAGQAEYEEARTCLISAAKRNPPWPELYFHLGLLEEQRGDYQAAVKYFEWALQLAPEDKDIHRKLAVMHLRRAEIEPAGSPGRIRYLERAGPHMEWLEKNHAAAGLQELYLELKPPKTGP